jgi:hypothetical protein
MASYTVWIYRFRSSIRRSSTRICIGLELLVQGELSNWEDVFDFVEEVGFLDVQKSTWLSAKIQTEDVHCEPLANIE